MSTMTVPDLTCNHGSAAQRLRLTTAAVRVSFTWLGVRKTLTPEQKSQAAESFGAEGDFLPPARSCSTRNIQRTRT